MRANGGRTKPERRLALALWHHGLRYLTSEGYRKRHGAFLPGKPDLVFPGRRTVIFLDGCFWHRCPTCNKVPEDMSEFWRCKLIRNQQRDAEVDAALRTVGWRVLRVWEHEVRRKVIDGTVARLAESLTA